VCRSSSLLQRHCAPFLYSLLDAQQQHGAILQQLQRSSGSSSTSSVLGTRQYSADVPEPMIVPLNKQQQKPAPTGQRQELALDLPDSNRGPWERVIDEKSGQPYWWNAKSGKRAARLSAAIGIHCAARARQLTDNVFISSIRDMGAYAGVGRPPGGGLPGGHSVTLRRACAPCELYGRHALLHMHPVTAKRPNCSPLQAAPAHNALAAPVVGLLLHARNHNACWCLQARCMGRSCRPADAGAVLLEQAVRCARRTLTARV
jgi:hypothetical protein